MPVKTKPTPIKLKIKSRIFVNMSVIIIYMTGNVKIVVNCHDLLPPIGLQLKLGMASIHVINNRQAVCVRVDASSAVIFS